MLVYLFHLNIIVDLERLGALLAEGPQANADLCTVKFSSALQKINAAEMF